MAHIYIRHGERVSDNIDSDITYNAHFVAQTQASNLLQYYGEPDYIITSPYQRCIQTAQALNSIFNNSKSIFIDPRISSKSSGKNNTISPGILHQDTFYYQPPLKEARPNVYRRIYDHRKQFENEQACVWFVTHRGVIHDLLEMSGAEPEYVEPLTALIYDGDSLGILSV